MKICALPTGNSIRPSDPESEYIDDFSQVTLYVLQITGEDKLRAYTSYGAHGEWAQANLAVGTAVRGDDAMFNSYRRINGSLGVTVVGIRHADGTHEGNVPAKKIPHWVAK